MLRRTEREYFLNVPCVFTLFYVLSKGIFLLAVKHNLIRLDSLVEIKATLSF